MSTPKDSVERIARRALARGIRIAAAESLTCGMLASTLGKGTDASEWFAGAVVAYRTDAKERVLGLRPGADPCSAECAEQLALAVRELLAADLSISTTGVGGPEEEDGHEPGTVYLGWATPVTTGHRLLRLTGDPREVLEHTVEHAVDELADLLDERAFG
ncbi:MAG TPA: CinA family protein [Microbacterium sp.]|nr:CinA family protein [Microbacterium sp.]